MNSTSLTVIALVLTTATCATAQSTQYLSYGTNYTNLSFEDESIDIFGLNGGIDYRSNAFILNGDFGFTRLSNDGDTASMTSLDARAGYIVTEDVVVYGGINYVTVTDDDNFSSYNLGAEYYVNGLTVGINYDDSDEEDYAASTTVYGSYQVNDTLEAAIGFTDVDGDLVTQIGADFDNGQFSLAAYMLIVDSDSLTGLDASYDFGNNFRAVGSYVDFGSDVNELSIGGGYQVSDDMWIDVSLGRIGDDDTQIDVIGLELSYEMGRETLLIDRVETLQTRTTGLSDLLVAK